MTIWSDVSFIVRNWLVTLWVAQLHQVTSEVLSLHPPRSLMVFYLTTFESRHRDPTLQPKFDIVWNCCWNNTRLLLKEPTGSANNTDVKRISKFYISFYQCLAQINHSYAYIYCIYIHRPLSLSIYLSIYIYIYIYIGITVICSSIYK